MSQSRQLAAIMFTDIVGYTAIMEQDEKKAIDILKKNLTFHQSVINEYRGRLIKELGDGILASFPTVSDALNAAIKIQEQCNKINEFKLNIAIHQGEVVIDNGDIFGDAVNIASRIQSLGIAGSILFSKKIADEVKNKAEFQTVSLGSFEFKNVNEPIEVFALANDGFPVPRRSRMEGKLKKNVQNRKAIAALAIILLLVVGYYVFPIVQSMLARSNVKIDKSNVKIDKSIAVLPFADMSPDHDQQYFSDGLSEGILNSLAHLKDLKVPARTSSFLFRGKDVDIREVGKKLGVKTVLEGSVQRQGDRLRITAQLINVEDGYHYWSEQYDENADDIFAVIDKISNTIVEKLEVTYLGTIVNKKPTKSKEAFELYLKGRFFWNKRLPAEVRKGIDFFNQAIDIDPLYAEAYSGIADCYTALGWGSFLSPKEAFPKAKEAADKALEIDSTLAEPHASLGYYKLYYERDWAVAEKEFKRAIALNPRYEIAYDWYGTYLTAMGRFEEARASIKKASDLDPLSPVFGSDMGFTLFYGGSYELSIKELQSTLELNPKYPIAHLWLSRAYQQKKMYPEAIAEYRKTLQVITDWPVALAGIGNIYGEMGEKAAAQNMLDTLTMLSSNQYVTSYGVALVYAGLGEKDKAFKWLYKSYDERSNFLVWLKVDPRWASIRSDKRYTELLRKVGLPL